MTRSVAKLRDLTTRVTKGTTPTSIGGSFDASGIHFVKVESITNDGRIDRSKLAYIDSDTNALLKRSILETDDLLFTIAGTIGRVARVREDLLPANTNQAVAIVRPDRSKVDVGYLFYALRAKEGLDHAKSRLVQSVQANLSLGDLSDLELLLPSLSEQRTIAAVLGALDDKIAANAHLVATAEAVMVAIATTATRHVLVSELAHQSTRSLRPEQFDQEVAHFSLPAFDSGARPENAEGVSIKSNKFVIDSSLVLISKLNPRIPRIWDIPKAPEMMALASTEFVPLKPIDVGSSELWSVLAQPEVTAALTGKVAGTSGSHQRVKPAEVLTLSVRDPRTLYESRRRALVTLGLIRYERRSESAGLGAIRDTLLPLLMSGKIRVKDAESVDEGVV